ncbi:phage/plasmid primase, P4 family [Streptomyces sp. NPDC006654]|uniref:DNA primase family protein n=1 Tax=Streptomyces sp. NPDC006654 TaxID=3156897 RepID=UPI0033E7ED00
MKNGMPTEADLAAMLTQVSRQQEPQAVPVASVPASRSEESGAEPPKPRADRISHGTLRGVLAVTDSFFVERVVEERLAAEYCWTPHFGWMHWNGKVWQRIDDAVVRDVVRQYVAEWVAGQVASPTVGADIKDLIKLLSTGRLSSITDLARGTPEMKMDGADFDKDPNVITANNGVIDLATGALMPHDKDRYLTRLVPTDYVPGARHDDVDAMLSAMEPEVADCMQIRLGQGITGYTPDDDVMLLFHGDGENGKSGIVDALTGALGGGTDFGAMTFIDDAVLTGDRDAKEERMALRGARLAVAEELPEGRRLNVVQLKKAVGTSVMKARHLYSKEVTWTTSHTLLITTNYLPVVNETDHGTWRRLALVPFPYKYVKGEPTHAMERRALPGIKDRLMYGRAQREATLAWLVAGARLWYQGGRKMPALPSAMVTATRAWRAESDVVLRYWNDRLTPDADAHVISTELVADFTAYLKEINQPVWSAKTIVDRFGSHEETKQNHVSKRQIQGQPGLSRPTRKADTWSGAPAPAPNRYMAWLGVRFAVDGL